MHRLLERTDGHIARRAAGVQLLPTLAAGVRGAGVATPPIAAQGAGVASARDEARSAGHGAVAPRHDAVVARQQICPTCGRAVSKTHAQRSMFHRLCRIIGNEVGLTPGKVKEAIKADFYGVDEFKVCGQWYRAVRSSEQSDRVEYGELIDFTYQWAAEREIVLDVPQLRHSEAGVIDVL